MFLKCERNKLIEAIGLVQKAVSSRSPSSILECFLLKCDEDSFKMLSTDTEIGIITSNIDCEIIENGSIALPSKFFSDIVRKLPEGIVSIQVKEKYVTIIKCEKTEFKIIGRNADEFPEIQEVSREREYGLKQAALKNLIRKTIFSMCQDETKPALAGSLIEIKDMTINMVTCDSFRISVCSESEFKCDSVSEEKAIIPSKTVMELFKLLTSDEEEILFYITEKHVLFDMGSCIMVSRLVEGEFINYANSFPEYFETKAVIDKSTIFNALDRAALVSFQEKKKNPVRFKMEDNNIVITTSTELGNLVDEFEIDLSGKEIEIAFNPKFVLDAVKSVDEENVSLEMNSKLSPCIIRPIGNDTYKYLILPLRI